MRTYYLKRSRHRNRGISLIIATMMIAMMILFVVDLIISSQVDLELSISTRDDVKAKYMAKSAENLGTLLLTIDWGVDLFTFQQNPKSLPTDSKSDIWAALNGLPIGGATVEMIAASQEKFELHSVNDNKVIDQFGLFDGQFIINIEDESSKINLNSFAKGTGTEAKVMLDALFNCPAEKMYLDYKKVDPTDLVAQIKDWIDSNNKPSPGSSNSSEDDPYFGRNPKYRAKNAPLDSLDELKMISGWGDDLHRIFSPYLTIYPIKTKNNQISKINLNTSDQNFLLCLLPKAKRDCSEKLAEKLVDIKENGGSLVAGENLSSFISATLCTNTSNDTTDLKDPGNWFSVRSDFYKITTTGIVGSQVKKISKTIQRTVPDKKNNVDKSYKLLDWRVL